MEKNREPPSKILFFLNLDCNKTEILCFFPTPFTYFASSPAVFALGLVALVPAVEVSVADLILGNPEASGAFISLVFAFVIPIMTLTIICEKKKKNCAGL